MENVSTDDDLLPDASASSLVDMIDDVRLTENDEEIKKSSKKKKKKKKKDASTRQLSESATHLDISETTGEKHTEDGKEQIRTKKSKRSSHSKKDASTRQLSESATHLDSSETTGEKHTEDGKDQIRTKKSKRSSRSNKVIDDDDNNEEAKETKTADGSNQSIDKSKKKKKKKEKNNDEVEVEEDTKQEEEKEEQTESTKEKKKKKKKKNLDSSSKSKSTLDDTPREAVPVAVATTMDHKNEANANEDVPTGQQHTVVKYEKAILTNTSTSNMIQEMIDRLINAKSSRPGTVVDLKEQDIVDLCESVRHTFLNEPTLIRTEAPIKIIGDLHGQFYDLLRILEHSGYVPNTKYLFLGDYCDRGKQSIETLCLLFAYKVLYPDRLYLLRGNHETSKVSRMYGFYDECKRRYSIKLWKTSFCAAFDCMPIAAIISDKIFCVHGGLSPELLAFEQIENLHRPMDLPEEGLACDLLWSDPEPGLSGWEENDRGVSFMFGADIVTDFLQTHDLDLIVRAHQVVEDGFEFFAGKRLLTIFSAPNYCGEFENCGATMIVDPNLKCRFQVLKPSKTKKRVAKLSPFEKLQKNSLKIKNVMRMFGTKADDLNLAGMGGKVPHVEKLASTKISIVAENNADHKSLRRSSCINVVDDNNDLTEFEKIRFEDAVLTLETENLTGRSTSWGDVWEDLFYSQDELAEFRYDAYLEEIEEQEE